MSGKNTEAPATATTVVEYIYQGKLYPLIAPEQDRMVRPKEAVIITGRSLASQHRDRKAGKWPPMYRLGDNSVANKLSDLLALNASREIIATDNTKPVAIPKNGKRRGRKPNMCK